MFSAHPYAAEKAAEKIKFALRMEPLDYQPFSTVCVSRHQDGSFQRPVSISNEKRQTSTQTNSLVSTDQEGNLAQGLLNGPS